MSKKIKYVVLFVEGETEKEFYESLIRFYRLKSKNAITQSKVFNVKGISRFEKTVTSKLKIEVLPKFHNSEIEVVCCYDTDVFELAQKPPINWKIVRKKVNDLGINSFHEIKAVKMIEDWFLKDIVGLSQYLKIDVPKKLEGKSGYEKIKTLFKKGKKPKVYQKGSNTHKFIPDLNIQLIRDAVKDELAPLEKALSVKL